MPASLSHQQRVLAHQKHADLIARLEKATGPDRKLDALIEAAVGVDPEAGLLQEGYWRNYEADDDKVAIWINGPNGHHRKEGTYSPAKLTGSFDAARTLIPEGLYWIVSEGRTRATEPLGGAQIFRPGYLVKPFAEAEHESAIIALCIAGLIAREATEQV